MYAQLDALESRSHTEEVEDTPIVRETLETLHSSLEELYTLLETILEQQSALEESHARLDVERTRYRDLFEFAPDGYLVTDPQGKLSEMNEAVTRLLNMGRGVLQGRPLLAFILPEDQPMFLQLQHWVAAGNPGQTWNLRVLRHDSEPFNAAIIARPVFDRDNRTVMGIRWLLRDMTAHVAQQRALLDSQAALAQANATLEQRVAKRTAELVTANQNLQREIAERKQAEEALRQAHQDAESATRSKSEFLATMSHEIRTPMNAVVGMTSLLLDTPLNAEQREYTETIRISSDAMITLINDVLDFSKIEAGRMELEHAPFNLRTCVEEALELLAPRAAEKGLELVYWLDTNTSEHIIGDITRVRQILVNLVGNGVKFTDTGGVFVMVSGREVQSEEQESSIEEPRPLYEVHMSVQDTGIGISPDRLDSLFQSFSQGDSSTMRRYGGSGLGLAISKQLAEMMGGSIRVESEVGRGSTFHVTFVAERSAGSKPPFLAANQPELQGQCVLVVGNNMVSRQFLDRCISQWGMDAHFVDTTSDALTWMRQQTEPCRVALLNVCHPVQKVASLAASIQSACQSSHDIPVLAVVSPAMRRQLSNNSAQITAFLVKPIRPALLHAALVSIMRGETGKPEHVFEHQSIDPDFAQHYPLRILLAEDNVLNQKVALRVLERMGYRADVAATGYEVLNALYRQQYDVVLMDIQMPEMDGIVATKRIRAQASFLQQPYIIAMTAHALEGTHQWCLDAGMNDYLGKPVRVDELVAKLKQAAGEGESEKARHTSTG